MKLSPLLPKVSLLKRVEYPVIAPVPKDVARPFWSVMIPTYNRTHYLEQALTSLLEQDPGPEKMQIEVVDNCSTKSDPEEIVRRVAGDRVSFYRQPYNIGLGGNLTACLQRAHGHWVHILHDDDMVLPGFYTAFERFIEEHPEIVMAFCRTIAIDENGVWMHLGNSAPDQAASGIVKNAGYKLAVDNYIVAPSVVVSRQACEKVGGFATELQYLMDWEMWGRLAKLGPIGYIHQPYFLYRRHVKSVGNTLSLDRQGLHETFLALEMNIHKLPASLHSEVRAAANRSILGRVLYNRGALHATGQHVAALRHAVQALGLHVSIRNVLRIFSSVLIMGKDKASKVKHRGR